MTAFLRHSPALAVLTLLCVALALAVALARPEMANAITLTTVLQFATILALVSLGQALVILAGGAGIDLSVGGTVSLSAILAMLALGSGMPPMLLPVACLGLGLALGAVNGVLVSRLGIYPLIVTLGTFYVYSGLALALTGGAAQGGVPAWALPFGRGTVGAVPLPFLFLVVPAFVLATVVLSLTSWGRWIYAMGYNETAARLTGIPVDRVRITLYTVCGGLGGLAGFVSLAWLGSGRPNVGVNLELESLTAAMLGGIAIFGGRGSIIGVFAAVILVVSLKTAMLQFGFNTVWQLGAVGTILIVVLLADRLTHARR
ncbi:MAG: ABC transporter permease [Pseudomonadota bacterium]